MTQQALDARTGSPTGQLDADEGIRLGVTVIPAFFTDDQLIVGSLSPTHGQYPSNLARFCHKMIITVKPILRRGRPARRLGGRP
jgi:hypothetical protein